MQAWNCGNCGLWSPAEKTRCVACGCKRPPGVPFQEIEIEERTKPIVVAPEQIARPRDLRPPLAARATRFVLRIIGLVIAALVLLALLSALVKGAEPETLNGRMLSVYDGDTFTLVDADGKKHQIRLLAIDAPELRQAYGDKARKALRERIVDTDVRVEWSKKDRNGRILGDVYAKDAWINRELVKEGSAWCYRESGSTEAERELREVESVARDKRRGLWDDKAPIPPWEWRKSRDKKQSGKPAF